jgi:hypothetical protein
VQRETWVLPEHDVCVWHIELFAFVVGEPVHLSKFAQVPKFTCALGKLNLLQLPPGGQSAGTTVWPPL